jgi:hypothetical protein
MSLILFKLRIKIVQIHRFVKSDGKVSDKHSFTLCINRAVHFEICLYGHISFCQRSKQAPEIIIVSP